MKFTSIMMMLLLALPGQLKAKNAGRDMTKEHAYEAQLSAIDPSLVEIYKTATIAMDKGDYVLSDSLYTLICKKAPTFDIGFRRLGTVKLNTGKVQEATELCDKAVNLNRSAFNLLTLAQCYLRSTNNSNLSSENPGKALEILKEGQRLPNGDEVDFYLLIAQAALQGNDISEFRSATHHLVSEHPEEMGTHYYAAVLASYDEEWTKANDEILIAKKMGLADTSVQAFLDSGVGSKIAIRKYSFGFFYIVLAWIAGLFLLFLLGKVLSGITLRSIENKNTSMEKSSMGQALRAIYRVLINIGGVYYYISLPIILILVLGLVVALFYLFMLAGRMPIQLMLVVGIGAIVTVFGMIRSLFLKITYSDPGRELTAAEAPGLFDLARNVAVTMGTRPIDEIRITPLTDLAVYERGSWREKLQDKAKRILILGVGVMKDFKQSDFKAVLAHEYGHFSHRDTAGGDVALRVRSDMSKYAYALYHAGQNVWWNMAFQFLRLYDFIFRRISHGATRLQEVMADRVAAKTYGVQAFQNGLTYVIRREIEFTTCADKEIEEAKKVKRPFLNLYELTEISGNTMEEELDKALQRKTSEDDTHPGPMDRFRYIEGIEARVVSNDNSYVRDLFVNWDSLTTEMTALIEERVRRQG